MYLGTIRRVDYYHKKSHDRDSIIEIAENKVEFVTHEDFDALVDKEHYRAEYLTYVNSMNSIAVIIISFLLLVSCSTVHNVHTKYADTYSILYGDERFDRCEDIIIKTYGVTKKKDTLVINVRPKYNCLRYKPYTWADKTIQF